MVSRPKSSSSVSSRLMGPLGAPQPPRPLPGRERRKQPALDLAHGHVDDERQRAARQEGREEAEDHGEKAAHKVQVLQRRVQRDAPRDEQGQLFQIGFCQVHRDSPPKKRKWCARPGGRAFPAGGTLCRLSHACGGRLAFCGAARPGA